MPLVLSLKEGQDFFVGDEQFFVDKIGHGNRFQLRGAKTTRLGNIKISKPVSFPISDEHATEILPEVFVSAGHHPPTAMARVAIEAPQDILILRGDKKRNPPAGVHEKALCL
jgi:hypothetical protein